MTNSTPTIYSIILLILMGMLVSCAPNPSTILQDKTCAPPCWNDITPGQTAKKEVLKTLPTLAEVDVESIKDAAVLTGGLNNNIYWISTSKSGDYGGRIFFKDDIVSVIDIGPKPGALTFGEAIQKLGDPEKILALTEIGDGPRSIVYLLYPIKGFALITYNNQSSNKKPVDVKENQPVKGVYYFRPELFDEIMTSGPVDFLTPNLITNGMQPWTGFGEITSISR